MLSWVEVSSPLNVHLEHYEGPLDLLLDLIRKQKINIQDIPIATITGQYLEYMDRAMALDMELGSEFVLMAATLIHIKSKMLLPRDPELEKISPEEDPRKELVDRLLEHERFRNAAQMLQQKRMVEDAVWTNPRIDEYLGDDDSPELNVTLFDLVKTLQDVLSRVKSRPIYEVKGEDVGVPDMIRYVRNLLGEAPKNKDFSVRTMFEQQRTRRAMICLFLAILELVKRLAIQLRQGEAFGEIVVRRDEGFDALFSSEQNLATIQEEYDK